jgi:large subunit ribosomal protein L9
MEVILLQDFLPLGFIGKRVSVRPGYARNFLLPRGIVAEVSSGRGKAQQHMAAVISAKVEKRRREVEEYAKNFLGLTLEFTLKGNEHGRVFGAVSLSDIEENLRSKGLSVDRRLIKLPETLKSAGEHKVNLHLHSEVVATINVRIKIDAPQPTPVKKSATEGVKGGEKRDKEGGKGNSKDNIEAPSKDKSALKKAEEKDKHRSKSKGKKS